MRAVPAVLGPVLVAASACFDPVCESRLHDCFPFPDAAPPSLDAGAPDAGAPDAGFSCEPGYHPCSRGCVPDAVPGCSVVLWFVTTRAYWGDEIGTLVGADQKCEAEGGRFGLSTVRALLSDSRTDLRDRLPGEGAVYNVKGEVLAAEPSALFPLPDFDALGVRANLDPDGREQDGLNPFDGFWWASDEHGVKEALWDSHFCSDWSLDPSGLDTAAQVGLHGRKPATGWVYEGCVAGNPAHLVCVAW